MRKSFVLSLILLLFIANIAFADENEIVKDFSKENMQTKETHNGLTDEKVNEKLRKLGFNDEQINFLNYETKLEIAKDSGTKKLLSFNRTSHNFNDNDPSKISLMSLTDDIYLNIIALDNGTRNGHPYIKLVADYNWVNMPFYRLWDGFAISWSEGWYGSSWGFTESQQYYSNVSYSFYWKSNTIYNATGEDRLAGVGWRYDLSSAAYDAKGTAYVYLEGDDESLIKSKNYSAFKAWYGHDQAASNLSVSIGLPMGAGIAAGVSFGGEEYTTDSTSIYNPSLTY